MDEQFWGDMLNVLKDINSYLEKQDTTVERAKIKDAPKMQENPEAIKGAEDPSFKNKADDLAFPGRISKNYVPEEDEEEDEEEEKLEEEEPKGDEEEEPEKDEKKEDKKDIDELKSLLKDISSALAKQSNVAEVVKAEIKKSLPESIRKETDKMLRKQGFVPTRPDVSRIDTTKSLGLDITQEVKKSEDIVKSEDKEQEDVAKIIDDMTKKSWTELGQLREKTDGFSPFTR